MQKTAFVLEAGPWLPRCEGLGVPVGCGSLGIRSRKDPKRLRFLKDSIINPINPKGPKLIRGSTNKGVHESFTGLSTALFGVPALGFELALKGFRFLGFGGGGRSTCNAEEAALLKAQRFQGLAKPAKLSFSTPPDGP